jgi:hypothetical protein
LAFLSGIPFMPMPTRPTRQFALNVVAVIRKGERARLEAVLGGISHETVRGMRGDAVPHPQIDFEKITGLHYARWVILPGRGDPYQSPVGRPPPDGPDALALNTWFDGPEGDPRASESSARRAHVTALVETGRPALDEVYSSCEGYPGRGADSATVVSYLLDHSVRTAALYFGSPGRTRDQIREEVALARRVREIVDQLRAKGPLPEAQQLRLLVLEHLGGPPPPPFPAQERHWFSLAGSSVVAAALALPLVPFIPWLRHLERTDVAFQPIFSQAERAHMSDSSAGENLFFENALSNVVEVKPGWLRGSLLRVVLLFIDALARDYFVEGKLGEIPSIHAAHWYPLDGGRRLAFVSNYDSSWESYLGDFIDQASTGLTAVWSNTSGYPPSRYLAFAGATAGQQFKAWSHHIQVKTQVWYSAYPNFSIVETNDATLIRRGLADEAAVPPHVWLARVT